MQGGKKGLIVNSRDLCAHKVNLTAQSGKTYNTTPVVVAKGCKRKKRR